MALKRATVCLLFLLGVMWPVHLDSVPSDWARTLVQAAWLGLVLFVCHGVWRLLDAVDEPRRKPPAT